MRSAAAAIAWEFRRRHRWGFAALAGYLGVLAAVRLTLLALGRPVPLDSPLQYAMMGIVPLSAATFYLLAVFSFGFGGDLAARASMYPTRMFTLPVTSAALAAWPMLYGAAAMVILWAALRTLALWPPGFNIPVVWPALMGVVLLAWTQALMWLPFPWSGVRVVVAVGWLTVTDIIVLIALHFEAPEPAMLGLLAPQVALAYLAARFGVARARCGEVPDWRPRLLARWRGGDPRRRRKGFDSPAQAQAWFEWRHQGRSLPALVAMVVPFELALLFIAHDAPFLAFEILIGALLTPPFLAVFAAAGVRKASPEIRDGYGVTPFLATRPVTSAELVAAKLRMAFRSTLLAWLVVLVAVPVALHVTGTWSLVIDRMGRAVDVVGVPRAVVFASLAAIALVSSTWKLLVQSLYIGLSGRTWAVKGNMVLALVILTILAPVVVWIGEDRTRLTPLWLAAPWILAGLALLKLCAAAWVTTRLVDARLVSDRALLARVAGWLLVVLVLHAVLVWLADTPFVPSYLLLLVAILMTPLARVSAAPLALAWNRHR